MKNSQPGAPSSPVPRRFDRAIVRTRARPRPSSRERLDPPRARSRARRPSIPPRVCSPPSSPRHPPPLAHPHPPVRVELHPVQVPSHRRLEAGVAQPVVQHVHRVRGRFPLAVKVRPAHHVRRRTLLRQELLPPRQDGRSGHGVAEPLVSEPVVEPPRGVRVARRVAIAARVRRERTVVAAVAVVVVAVVVVVERSHPAGPGIGTIRTADPGLAVARRPAGVRLVEAPPVPPLHALQHARERDHAHQRPRARERDQPAGRRRAELHEQRDPHWQPCCGAIA